MIFTESNEIIHDKRDRRKVFNQITSSLINDIEATNNKTILDNLFFELLDSLPAELLTDENLENSFLGMATSLKNNGNFAARLNAEKFAPFIRNLLFEKEECDFSIKIQGPFRDGIFIYSEKTLFKKQHLKKIYNLIGFQLDRLGFTVMFDERHIVVSKYD